MILIINLIVLTLFTRINGVIFYQSRSFSYGVNSSNNSSVTTGVIFNDVFVADESTVDINTTFNGANTTDGPAISGSEAIPTGSAPGVIETQITLNSANNRANSTGGEAISGTSIQINDNIVPRLAIETLSYNNSASTNSNEEAISGSSNTILLTTDSIVSIAGESQGNEASSEGNGPAISGGVTRFGLFDGGSINFYQYAANNNAESLALLSEESSRQSVSGAVLEIDAFEGASGGSSQYAYYNNASDDSGMAVAGIKTLIDYIEDSSFQGMAVTYNNTAEGDHAIAGTKFSIGNAINSNVGSSSINAYNVAQSSYSATGPAIAGSDINFEYSYNSTLNVGGNNKYNVANSQNTVTIAGSRTDFGNVTSSNAVFSLDDFKNKAESGVGAIGGSMLAADTVSNSNFTAERENSGSSATTYNGVAVAGVFNKIGSFKNGSDVYFFNEGENGTAIVYGEGHAIAGVKNEIDEIEDSDLEMVNAAVFNVAKNYGNGDAIAGSHTTINNVTNSILNITNEEQYNIAEANNGSAIVGGVIVIDSVTNNGNVRVTSTNGFANNSDTTSALEQTVFTIVSLDNTSIAYECIGTVCQISDQSTLTSSEPPSLSSTSASVGTQPPLSTPTTSGSSVDATSTSLPLANTGESVTTSSPFTPPSLPNTDSSETSQPLPPSSVTMPIWPRPKQILGTFLLSEQVVEQQNTEDQEDDVPETTVLVLQFPVHQDNYQDDTVSEPDEKNQSEDP